MVWRDDSRLAEVAFDDVNSAVGEQFLYLWIFRERHTAVAIDVRPLGLLQHRRLDQRCIELTSIEHGIEGLRLVEPVEPHAGRRLLVQPQQSAVAKLRSEEHTSEL